jgi:protease IV
MRFLINFFRKLWRALDVFRRVLHLLLLLLIFGVIAGAMSRSAPTLPSSGALLIRPAGNIVEQLSGEPLQRALNEAQGQAAPETLLWDITEAIRSGAKDQRVKALLIDTNDMGGAGQAKLEEIAAAIVEFKKSGKKVVASGASFDQSSYYLAAQADEIYLDPQGTLLLTGYGRYTPYLKDALDKLNVDVHLYRAGKYKSAAEMFTRRDMSAEDREATLAYLNALWTGYRNAVGKARHQSPEQISAYVEQLGTSATAAKGDFAALAKSAGLITDIKSDAQVARRMTELVGADAGADDPDAFAALPMADYLKQERIEKKLQRSKGSAVGVVVASGDIAEGDQPPGTIGGVTTSKQLRRARLDEDIKAVVLRVDSPGGSVFASEQIYREVQALKAGGKTVVVSMGDYAASGGYYIAAPADEIIASPNTVTGSIGVFGVFPTVDRSLEKLGVHSDGVGTTPLAGALTMIRPVSPLVDQLIQASIDHTYEQFLQHVASGRDKTRDQIDAIAQGRVWAGTDALRLGLVDRLGTYQDALNSAARRAGLGTDYRIKAIEPELSFTERLLLRMETRAALWARSMAPQLYASNERSASLSRWALRLQPAEAELARIEGFAHSRQGVVYCFCGAH